MRLRNVLSALVYVSLVSACQTGSDGDNPSADDLPTYSLTTTELSFSTGKYSIPSGDSFECFYTPIITDRELNIHNGYGKQAPGGHHITVYYTITDKQKPGHHPCKDEEMVNLRMVAGVNDGTGGSAEGLVELPEGLAIRVPAGAQIVTQSHYINASLNERQVNDHATVNLLSPEQVKSYSNYMVFNDADFEIKPMAPLQRVTTCVTPREVNLVLYLGHMHEKGTFYKLERIDDKGQQLELLYEHNWEPAFTSHPPVRHFPMEAPKVLPKGTRLRQTCKWMNNTTSAVRFPREMCLAFMYYFPDEGELDCEIQSGM